MSLTNEGCRLSASAARVIGVTKWAPPAVSTGVTSWPWRRARRINSAAVADAGSAAPVTIEMKVTYLEPAQPGRVTARGAAPERPDHRMRCDDSGE